MLLLPDISAYQFFNTNQMNNSIQYYYEIRNPKSIWGPFLTELTADRQLEDLQYNEALSGPFKIYKIKSANNSSFPYAVKSVIGTKENGRWNLI